MRFKETRAKTPPLEDRGAGRLLTAEKTKTNTHASIIRDFYELFVASKRIQIEKGFSDLVLQIRKNEPTAEFAKNYLEDANGFCNLLNSSEIGT